MFESASARGRIVARMATALAPWLLMGAAQAADLTVNSSRTTPVTTSNIDGGPGNVVVESNGSISVGDPAAIVIDSSNTVVNNGNLVTGADSNAAVITAITTDASGAARNLASGISNTLNLSATGAAGSGPNAGIRIRGLGTFSGAVTNSGTIGIASHASYGIDIGSPLIGDVVNGGTISLAGAQNVGIFTTGTITGNITNAGSIAMPADRGLGMYIGNTVTGTIIQSGTITGGTGPQIDYSSGNPVNIPQVNGGGGIWLAGSVNQGLLLAGNGYTRAQEAADTSISTTGDSVIANVGSAPGLLVAPGGAGGYKNIVIGVRTDTPFGIVNNGNILTASSAYNLNTVAVDIKGATDNGLNYTTRLDGGFFNAGGNLNATARDGTATGFHVGAFGFVPELRNSGDILVGTTDSTADNSRGLVGTAGGNAYGVVIDAGGSMDTFTNSGNLTVTSQGPNSSFGFLDNSGTVKTFTNSGTISAKIDRLSTGRAVAVDLRANTTGVDFTNTGTITGPVMLGSGTNRFTMSGGTLTGDLSFVGGTSTLNVTNSTLGGNVNLGAATGVSSLSLVNATLNGGLTANSGSGTVNLVSQGSRINIPSSQALRVTNASFDGNSTVAFNLGGLNTGGVLAATGNVSIASGAKLTPVFTGIIRDPQTIRLISAGSLSLGGSLSSLVTSNVSYMNIYSTQIDPANANSVLLSVRRRTAAEIGLDANFASAYEGAMGALSRDDGVATAISSQTSREGFVGAFRQLMPDATDATRQIAVATQDLANGAVRRRLEGIKDQRVGETGDRSSMWFQTIGAGVDAGGSGDQLGYSLWGVGVALGADTKLGANGKIGLAFMQMFDSVDFGASPNSPLIVYGSHLNLYARQNMGPVYIQGLAGGGLTNYEGTREVTIGTFRRTAKGNGNGYQYGGTVEIGLQIPLGKFEMEPWLRGTYVKLHQNTYSETEGGDGINLIVDAHDQTIFRGAGGFNVGRQFELFYDSVIDTDFRASVNHEFNNTPGSFMSRFAADTTPFMSSVLLHGPNFYSAGFSIGHKDSFSSVTLDYDGQVAGKYVGHTATISLRFRL